MMLLSSVATFPQASPPEPTNESRTASPAKRTPEPESAAESKEGKTRIFGIFPAFNVTNQVNPEPMTNGEKFKLFARGSYDPVTLITPALKVPILQAVENGSSFGDGFSGFMHRYGVSLADGTSSRFFRQFVFPAVLKEDPRYFRMGDGTIGARTKYGLSRLFVTKTDSGNHRFNFSRLLGSGASAGLSIAYYPASQRTGGTTVLNFGLSYASEAGSNLLKEFAPDIARKLSRKKKVQQLPSQRAAP
jgi:hypothetical protein